LLADLGQWVTWLERRYSLTDVIPDCWAAHPALLEELLALYVAWTDAYGQLDASGTAPIKWHESFAQCRERLREWNRWGCGPDSHRHDPDPEPSYRGARR
jgi:hypothetical protein